MLCCSSLIQRVENMAAGHINRLTYMFTRVCNSRNVRQLRAGSVLSRHTSSARGPSIDNSSNVEIGVTSDGKTIVCFHPSVDVPYDVTQPIPRPHALHDQAETHEQVLKAKLSKDVLNDKQAPTIEELSRMFYTTKHRWYPVGQYHTRRRNRNPPKDR